MRAGSSELGVEGGRKIADSAVRPEGVVIVFPARKRLAGMIERGEDRLVEQLVTEPAVEALDEGVLRRLAGRDVMPF